MKKIIKVFFLLLGTYTLQAQNVFEASLASSLPISGTARSVGMSGAFGALGCDPSATLSNPAGLAIYRSSELSLSLNNIYQYNRSNWGISSVSDDNRFQFANLSYIYSLLRAEGSGLVASNFSFSYNRLKSFKNNYNIKGNAKSSSVTDYIANMTNGLNESDLTETENYQPFENTDVGWLSALAYPTYLINPTAKGSTSWQSLNSTLVVPQYMANEYGSIDEYSFNYGANIANIVYLGVGVGLQMLNYKLISSYSESFETGESLNLSNNVELNGVGYNFKIGVIVPVSFFRFGIAYHTPTFYALAQKSAPVMYSYNVINDLSQMVDATTTAGESTDAYYLRTPSRLLASVAFVFDKKILLDVDYEVDFNRTMRYSDSGHNNFDSYNKAIKEQAKTSHAVKFGFEYRLLNFLSLRAGGAIATPIVLGSAEKNLPLNSVRTDVEYFIDKGTFYVSGGVGFELSRWRIDFAYQYKQNMLQFKPYATQVDGMSVNVGNYSHQVLGSLSYRF